jgi:hypothetical protein
VAVTRKEDDMALNSAVNMQSNWQDEVLLSSTFDDADAMRSNTNAGAVFVSENAGYNNALFTYDLDAAGNVTQIRQVMDNSNKMSGGASLGDVSMTNGQPNLLLLPNGAAAVDENSQLSLVDGKLQVDGQAYSGEAYFSHSALLSTDGEQHFEINTDEAGQTTIKMEDLRNLGDADFNDLVIKLLGNQDFEAYVSSHADLEAAWNDMSQPGTSTANHPSEYAAVFGQGLNEQAVLSAWNAVEGRRQISDVGDLSKAEWGMLHFETWGKNEGRIVPNRPSEAATSEPVNLSGYISKPQGDAVTEALVVALEAFEAEYGRPVTEADWLGTGSNGVNLSQSLYETISHQDYKLGQGLAGAIVESVTNSMFDGTNTSITVDEAIDAAHAVLREPAVTAEPAVASENEAVNLSGYISRPQGDAVTEALVVALEAFEAEYGRPVTEADWLGTGGNGVNLSQSLYETISHQDYKLGQGLAGAIVESVTNSMFDGTNTSITVDEAIDAAHAVLR